MLTLAIATGLVCGWSSGASGAHLAVGNRILERRERRSAIGGRTAGSVAFLLANRLLPLGIAERPAMEVSVAFVDRGGGLARRRGAGPAPSWPLLLEYWQQAASSPCCSRHGGRRYGDPDR